MMNHARRVLGFALLPAMSMLAPLLILPIVARVYGPDGWSAIALGQSVGAILGLVVALAWPTIGGHQVSVAPKSARAGIYIESVGSRLLMLLIFLPIGLAVILIIGAPLPAETAVFMVGIALNGLTASWFYSGTGQPRHLVTNEGLVRLFFYLLAAGVMLVGAPLIAYALLTVIAGLMMVALNWATIVGARPSREHVRLRGWVATIRAHLYGTFSRLLQGSFAFGGVPIGAVVAPSSLGSFSAADQLTKAASNAGAALPAAFVGWVGATSDGARRRGKVAVLACAVLLSAAVAVWMIIGTEIVELIYGGESGLGRLEVILIGVAMFGNVSSRIVELLVLVPRGLARVVYSVNTLISSVGLISLPFAFIWWGTFGGLVVYAAAPLFAVVIFAVWASLAATGEPKS